MQSPWILTRDQGSLYLMLLKFRKINPKPFMIKVQRMRKQTHRQFAKKGDRNNKSRPRKYIGVSASSSLMLLRSTCMVPKEGFRGKVNTSISEFLNEKCCWGGMTYKSRSRVSRKNSNVHQNEGWEAIIKAPLHTWEQHRAILTGEQKKQ